MIHDRSQLSGWKWRIHKEYRLFLIDILYIRETLTLYTPNNHIIIVFISQDYIFPSRISKKFNRLVRFWRVLQINCCWTTGYLECPSQSYRCLHYFVKYTCHHLLHQECQFAHAHQLSYSKPCGGRLSCWSRFCARLARTHLQRRRSEFYLV